MYEIGNIEHEKVITKGVINRTEFNLMGTKNFEILLFSKKAYQSSELLQSISRLKSYAQYKTDNGPCRQSPQ